MGDKARTQSAKYPCGTCNLECKDGSVSFFNVFAGTTPLNVPALLQVSLDVCKKIQDLFGCVKTAKRVVKKLLRNRPDDINEIGSKLDCIQRQLTE